MKFRVLTLFPDMIEQAASVSILGRAAQNGYIQVDTINIRDYSVNKYGRVDDYPYGGGAGMVMEAEPVYRAVQKAKEELGENTRVIYMTPQARVLDQTKVEELAMEKNLILLCGHYEGIDDRVLQEVVTDYISIGDYVLTGGELGALVVMDAVSRFVPGVLSNEESSQFESLQDNLLEYPHYTRPELWHEKKVPSILMSGDHKKVEAWRFEQSKIRTMERRPDLLESYRNIKVVTFGSERCLEEAEKFSAILSRYGQILNYNRAKLRKSKTSFAKNDVLVLFMDRDKMDEITFSDIIKNMRLEGCQVFLIELQGEAFSLTSKEKEEMLEKKGAGNLKTLFLENESDEEALRKAALEIRKNMQGADI